MTTKLRRLLTFKMLKPEKGWPYSTHTDSSKRVFANAGTHVMAPGGFARIANDVEWRPPGFGRGRATPRSAGATARIRISAVSPSWPDGDVQDDALALLLDVGDANDTGCFQRDRAPELGRRYEGPRLRSASDRLKMTLLGESCRKPGRLFSGPFLVLMASHRGGDGGSAAGRSHFHVRRCKADGLGAG
jgi:hypothetical protein